MTTAQSSGWRPSRGAHPAQPKEVAELLDRVATEGTPVRHLERRGAPRLTWKAKDLSGALAADAASDLRSLELWSNGFDVAAYRALAEVSLDSLESLDVRFATNIDGEGLRALGAGEWPNLRHLALGSVEATLEELLELLDALPALTSLAMVEWSAARESLGDFFADPRFARIRSFVPSTRVVVADGECLVRLAEAHELALEELALPAGSAAGPGLGVFLRSDAAKRLRRLQNFAIVPASSEVVPADCPFPAPHVAGKSLDPALLSAVLPSTLASLKLTDANLPQTAFAHAMRICASPQRLELTGSLSAPTVLDPLEGATSLRDLRLRPVLEAAALARAHAFAAMVQAALA